MCINRGGCNVRSGDEFRLAPTHVTLDIPFQLILFASRRWKQEAVVSAWLAGPRQVPSRCLDRRLDTAQRSTAPHATRLHVIDVTQMP